MVKIALEINAFLENVSSLQAVGEEFRWYLKLKCSSCGEVSSSWQYVSLSESTETKGGRGSASMVQKCKMCGRENHLDILNEHVKSYTVDTSGQYAPVVAFECRGLEPKEFDIRSGWVVTSCFNTLFEDVDLSEKEWYDYDEKGNQSVSITELTYKFVKLKK
ncbi:CXXC motif containing zinc binding protein-like [Clavelina lepadiformis]|uniref:CXXC motif containing zinc binding protein-like n=1 Tax=Clavelina lepadiformis TaxID=159417 RepID=UPI0040437D76